MGLRPKKRASPPTPCTSFNNAAKNCNNALTQRRRERPEPSPTTQKPDRGFRTGGKGNSVWSGSGGRSVGGKSPSPSSSVATAEERAKNRTRRDSSSLSFSLPPTTAAVLASPPPPFQFLAPSAVSLFKRAVGRLWGGGGGGGRGGRWLGAAAEVAAAAAIVAKRPPKNRARSYDFHGRFCVFFQKMSSPPSPFLPCSNSMHFQFGTEFWPRQQKGVSLVFGVFLMFPSPVSTLIPHVLFSRMSSTRSSKPSFHM